VIVMAVVMVCGDDGVRDGGFGDDRGCCDDVEVMILFCQVPNKL